MSDKSDKNIQPDISDVIKAAHALKGIAVKTVMLRDKVLSEKYQANIYLKREDLQVVRSFKLRGAYNKIVSIPREKLENGVVCASAGNHAQGVAHSCRLLNVPGKIFMPVTTPRQKVDQVYRLGGEYIDIIFFGDTFDDASVSAKEYTDKHGLTFIHPFDDPEVIAGQGTVGLEIMNNDLESVDYCFLTIGGGGLAAGVASYIKGVSPDTKIIGVEPAGAAGMKTSIEAGHVVALQHIDTFVDGAAVKTVGELTFKICRELLDDIVTVPEGKVCTTMLELYNQNALVTEPSGALPISALDAYADKIKGKNVVCIVSGGNNDIERMADIKERSLLYEGLKHYFVVNFPQRPGALREFVGEVLGPHDDITHFEYIKRTTREKGSVLIGIELADRDDYEGLVKRMSEKGFEAKTINDDPLLFGLLV